VERLDLSATQSLAGVQLPGVPKFSYTLGADGNQPLGNLGGREITLYGHFDYSHRSSFNTTSNNSVAGTVPGFGLANARLGLRTSNGLWDVSVFAKNLFDKDYFLSLGVANTGLVTGQVGEPRTCGVTLRTRL
jgi:iron complex outermembrane receptor protein